MHELLQGIAEIIGVAYANGSQSRLLAVIASVVTTIITITCVWTVWQSTTSMANLLPVTALVATLITVVWLRRRPWQQNSIDEVRMGTQADELIVPPQSDTSLALPDVPDEVPHQPERLEAVADSGAPISALISPDGGSAARHTRRVSIIGAIGGLVSLVSLHGFVVLMDRQSYFQYMWKNSFGPFLCCLPVTLITGVALGAIARKTIEATGVRLGFKVMQLRVITLIGAGLAAVVGTVILDFGLTVFGVMLGG
jgi:hypothetical protein